MVTFSAATYFPLEVHEGFLVDETFKSRFYDIIFNLLQSLNQYICEHEKENYFCLVSGGIKLCNRVTG